MKMKWKTSILLGLFSLSAHATDCGKHPIYCQIKKNSPKINKKHAMKISNIIYKMHRKYHIPTRIFTAILRQESNYTLKTNGCHSGLRELTSNERTTIDNRCTVLKEKVDRGDWDMYDKQTGDDGKAWAIPEHAYHQKCVTNKYPKMETKICSDYGISQIYYKTARRFGIDIKKLTTDLEYSIEAGARVLADFMKRYEAKDNDWWVRYNCGSRGTTKRDTCQIYKKMVERYL